MEKYKTYEYSQIEQFAQDNNFEISDIGNNCLGENFIILKNAKDEVISFVYSGYNGHGGSFTCIYNDTRKKHKL